MLDINGMFDMSDTVAEAAGLATGQPAAEILSKPTMKEARFRAATIKLGDRVRSTEDRFDVAGIGMAELLASALQSRMDAKLAATFAPDVISDIIEAINAWGQSRSTTVRVHKRLLRISGVLGTREVAGGDVIRPDQDG